MATPADGVERERVNRVQLLICSLLMLFLRCEYVKH